MAITVPVLYYNTTTERLTVSTVYYSILPRMVTVYTIIREWDRTVVCTSCFSFGLDWSFCTVIYVMRRARGVTELQTHSTPNDAASLQCWSIPHELSRWKACPSLPGSPFWRPRSLWCLWRADCFPQTLRSFKNLGRDSWTLIFFEWGKGVK